MLGYCRGDMKHNSCLSGRLLCRGTSAAALKRLGENVLCLRRQVFWDLKVLKRPILSVFGCRRVPRARQPPGGCPRRVPGHASKKPLGSLPLHLRGRAPSGRHGGGSRPALPGLHDVLCLSRSSGSFGLRVAVVEPSAKTLGFRV